MGKEDIAARLRQARLSAGKTQKEVADCLGITYQAVSNYERGKTKVESDVLIKLSRIYGISVPALLGEPVEAPVVSECTSDSFTEEETQLISNYRKLSRRGKELIQEQMSLALLAYTEKNNASSDLEEAQ